MDNDNDTEIEDNDDTSVYNDYGNIIYTINNFIPFPYYFILESKINISLENDMTQIEEDDSVEIIDDENSSLDNIIDDAGNSFILNK